MTAYEGPKTVTFNPEPQTEAQFRSARLGSRVIGWTLGVAAAGMTGVATLWSLGFALSLAVSWGETIKLGLVAIGLPLALSGLPVASALMARAYPKEAQLAMLGWAAALLVLGLSLGFFVLTLNIREAPVGGSVINENVLRKQLYASQYQVRDDVWHETRGCRKTADRFQYRHCREVIAYRQRLEKVQSGQSWDFSPAAILPVVMRPEDSLLRRLMVLLLGLLTLAGAGCLGRFAVLVMAESYRLGTGEASFEPKPVVEEPVPEPMPQTPAQSQDDVFMEWAAWRLDKDPAGEISAADALADYQALCQHYGYAPYKEGKFGSNLTALANASGGQISKQKSGGRIIYRGWSLKGKGDSLNGTHAH